MKKLFAILIFSNFIVSGIFVSGNAFKESSLQNKTLNISEVPGNDDPFAKYMESVPMVLQTLSIVNAGTSAEAIVTRRIIFSSRNGTSKVYAIISYPNLPGKYPALLILHGGGGNADGLKPLLERFARNGYVTFTLDMPGICGTRSTPNTEGPWKSRPEYDEAPRFNVANGPEYSTLVDAEVAGIEAFNLYAIIAANSSDYCTTIYTHIHDITHH